MPNREPAFLHHPHQAAGMFGSLQEAYDRLDAIIESSYDGIFITDGQAVTIRVNQAYLTITGLRAEEVLGRTSPSPSENRSRWSRSSATAATPSLPPPRFLTRVGTSSWW